MTKRVEVLIKENGETVRDAAFNVEDDAEAPSEEEIREGAKESYQKTDYVCDECGDEFDSPQALAGHNSSH